MTDIPMEVYFNTGVAKFDSLDFNGGSKALEGASEVAVISAGAILDGSADAPKKISSIKGIHARFKASFEGSFKQHFVISVHGEEQNRALVELGEQGYSEVVRFVISKAIGVNFEASDARARKWISKNRENAFAISDRLIEPLLRMHKPVEKQGYTVSFRRRGREIFALNKNTLDYMKKETKEKDSMVINVGVSRFNARTGTGRCIHGMDEDSISFSPATAWKKYATKQKKKLSANLNTITGGEFKTMEVEVRRVLDVYGRVKHYKLVRVLSDE